MTCIVLDDEELSVNFIVERNIKKVPYLTLLGAFTDPQEALRFLQTNSVDLIFLDIEMPNFDIDGIDFMRLTKAEQRYILVTAHPEYALESYEYNVVDYLRKPFSFDRFAKAVQKAQQSSKASAPSSNAGEDSKASEALMLRSNKKLQRVLFDTIHYIEADRNYATVFRDGDPVAAKITLSQLEEDLPADQFIRVHKSYIIALDKIDFVGKDQIGISRAEGIAMVPLSSQYKKIVLEAVEKRFSAN